MSGISLLAVEQTLRLMMSLFHVVASLISCLLASLFLILLSSMLSWAHIFLTCVEEAIIWLFLSPPGAAKLEMLTHP